jgi:uncharacterized protein (DUF2141 family)
LDRTSQAFKLGTAMTNPSQRRLGTAAAWLVLIGTGGAAGQDPPRPGHGPARAALGLRIADFASDRGQALVALYRGPQGFPREAQRAVWREALRIERREVRVTIDTLSPGRYAVALVHDENGDFKLNTGLFGIPREGFGASRDAPVRFGPPRFQDAVFELKPGEHKQLTVRVRYLRPSGGPRQR